MRLEQDPRTDVYINRWMAADLAVRQRSVTAEMQTDESELLNKVDVVELNLTETRRIPLVPALHFVKPEFAVYGGPPPFSGRVLVGLPTFADLGNYFQDELPPVQEKLAAHMKNVLSENGSPVFVRGLELCFIEDTEDGKILLRVGQQSSKIPPKQRLRLEGNEAFIHPAWLAMKNLKETPNQELKLFSQELTRDPIWQMDRSMQPDVEYILFRLKNAQNKGI